MSGKQTCKRDLLETFALPQEHLERPVIGIVSRFADQKGFDLMAEKAHALMKEDLVLVVLGTGDKKYERLFGALAATYPGRVGLKIAYDNTLAHKVEAGADMFLMPSRYEPSGLNQMYSLKYGTVPIVRATGGLDDSIQPFDVEHGTGTGFKFYEYSGEALLYAVRQALHHYMDERIWRRIQLNGMAKDFSWKGPAREYANLYEAARVTRGFAPMVQKVEKVEKVETAERVEKAEKEAESERSSRRVAKKAAKVVGRSAPGGGKVFQGPEQSDLEKDSRETAQSSVRTAGDPGQTAQDSGQGAEGSGQSIQSLEQDPQESRQPPQNSEQAPEEVGEAPQGSGQQAGRNQKPARTSN